MSKQSTADSQVGCPLGFWAYFSENDLIVLKWNAAGEQFDVENIRDPENIPRFRLALNNGEFFSGLGDWSLLGKEDKIEKQDQWDSLTSLITPETVCCISF